MSITSERLLELEEVLSDESISDRFKAIFEQQMVEAEDQSLEPQTRNQVSDPLIDGSRFIYLVGEILEATKAINNRLLEPHWFSLSKICSTAVVYFLGDTKNAKFKQQFRKFSDFIAREAVAESEIYKAGDSFDCDHVWSWPISRGEELQFEPVFEIAKVGIYSFHMHLSIDYGHEENKIHFVRPYIDVKGGCDEEFELVRSRINKNCRIWESILHCYWEPKSYYFCVGHPAIEKLYGDQSKLLFRCIFESLLGLHQELASEIASRFRDCFALMIESDSQPNDAMKIDLLYRAIGRLVCSNPEDLVDLPSNVATLLWKPHEDREDKASKIRFMMNAPNRLLLPRGPESVVKEPVFFMSSNPGEFAICLTAAVLLAITQWCKSYEQRVSENPSHKCFLRLIRNCYEHERTVEGVDDFYNDRSEFLIEFGQRQ